MEELKKEVFGGARLQESNTDDSQYDFLCKKLCYDEGRLEDLISRAEEAGIVINRPDILESNYGNLCFRIYKDQLDAFKCFCEEQKIKLT